MVSRPLLDSWKQTCSELVSLISNALLSSGVVRQSAAWGENKKCRPYLYSLRLFEWDSGSFDRLFCLPKIWIWFKWNKKLWTALFHESLTVTIYFSQNHSPTRHCGLVVSAPACDGSGCEFDSWQCRIYIPCSLTHDYLVPFRVLWVHMAWHRNCVLKKLAHFGKLWIQYSTATLPIHPLHDTPDKQSLANLFLQFFNDIIERIRSKFTSSDSPIPIFFQSFLHIYLISIQPLSRKFIISSLLLNVIHLIKSIPCLNLVIFIPETFVVFSFLLFM